MSAPRKSRWKVLLLAAAAPLLACNSNSGNNVNRLEPESVLPIVPKGVERGEGELLETKDLFRGKQIVIQIERTRGRITRAYEVQKDAALQSSPLRTQDDWVVFDWDPGYPPDTPPPPQGDSYVKPGGFIYAKARLVQSGRLDWFVLCSRLKFRDTPRGCWLRGRIGDKYYEVMMNEPDLPYAEDLNTFIQAHL